MPSFATIIQTIEQNAVIDQSLLLPYLCVDSIEERLRYNHALATTYHAVGNIVQAKVFMERAWLFSNFSEEMLPLYEEINSAVDDLDALREAHKRVGMNRARIGGVEAALPFFMQSMYTYAHHGRGDSYVYDFDILHEIEHLAEPLRFSPPMRKWSPGVRKLRIAYLVYGATQNQSVIIKILSSIGQFHNKEHFEFAFFIPENELIEYGKFSFLRENIRSLETLGEIVVVSNGTNNAEALLEIASQIYDYSPDILVTSALLADLKQYYIASLHPAPLIIGLTMGPPQQFSAPLLDWSITFDHHCLMDCMSDCSRVPLEVELPSEHSICASRSEYGIPDDAVVIVAAGRASKFLNRDFWETLAAVMTAKENVYLIIIGLTQKPSFIDEVITEQLVRRTLLLSWLDDYCSLLRISDIMVDTYPSGGGVTIMDAMGLEVPVLTFGNNYMHLFDQTDWSPGEWVVGLPELIAVRGDWSSMRKILDRLVDDREYRIKMGHLCRQVAIEKRGSPERMVRNVERVFQDVFLKVYKFRSTSNASNLPATSSPDASTFRDVMEKRINFWRFQDKFLQRDEVHLAACLTRFPFLVSILLKLELIIKTFHNFKNKFIHF